MEYGIKNISGSKAETFMAFLTTNGCQADIFESVSKPGHFSLTRVEPGEEDQVRFSDVYGPTEDEALEKMADIYAAHGVAINGFTLAEIKAEKEVIKKLDRKGWVEITLTAEIEIPDEHMDKSKEWIAEHAYVNDEGVFTVSEQSFIERLKR